MLSCLPHNIKHNPKGPQREQWVEFLLQSGFDFLFLWIDDVRDGKGEELTVTFKDNGTPVCKLVIRGYIPQERDHPEGPKAQDRIHELWQTIFSPKKKKK
jgi:hypothetical protein